MMKLYYLPGACSLASHIALREAGAEFEIDRVDRETRRTESGEDYLALNPKGYVPALKLDGGAVLTEGPAILQFIADRHPGVALAPPGGTLERARLQEQLNYIGTELHKSFTPLFRADSSEAEKEKARTEAARRFDHVERLLGDGRSWLLGDRFSVADAYLFVVSRWTARTGIDLSRWPAIAAFVERVGARPAVREALAAEGIAG